MFQASIKVAYIKNTVIFPKMLQTPLIYEYTSSSNYYLEYE